MKLGRKVCPTSFTGEEEEEEGLEPQDLTLSGLLARLGGQGMVSKASRGETHIPRVNVTPLQDFAIKAKVIGYYHVMSRRYVPGWVCYCVCVKEELAYHVNRTGAIESLHKPRTP